MAEKKPVLVFAHRGNNKDHPENTISAFESAIEVGADGIELDVHLSKDGEAVVMHDGSVDRTTNGTGKINALDYHGYIDGLDAGDGNPPPLLEAVLELCKKARLVVNIEIKDPLVVDKVAGIVKSLDLGRGVLFSSFKHETLGAIASKLDGARTAALVPVSPAGFAGGILKGIFSKSDQSGLVDAALSAGATAINPFHGTCTQQFMKRALEAGLEIYPWTVDSPAKAKKLASWGANGIITNDPKGLMDAGIKEG